jgi:hypothetical protein
MRGCLFAVAGAIAGFFLAASVSFAVLTALDPSTGEGNFTFGAVVVFGPLGAIVGLIVGVRVAGRAREGA